MENRNGLVVNTRLTHANGTAEREAALAMIAQLPAGPVTLGADKGYDRRAFVAGLRELSDNAACRAAIARTRGQRY